MFSLFNLFGRSAVMNALDDALRESGVYPLLVPEAVKLTLVRFYEQENFGDAAQLLAYCMQGRDQFIVSNSVQAADRAEHRLEAAIDAGGSLDAKLILLALHSNIIDPEVADRFDADDG